MLGERFTSGLIEACEEVAEHLSWRFDFMLEEPGTSGSGDIGKQLMLDNGRLHVCSIPSEAFLV